MIDTQSVRSETKIKDLASEENSMLIDKVGHSYNA